MNLKALMEKRDELQQQMEQLISTADSENRAMTGEEILQFDAAEAEIRGIDDTIARADKARNLQKPTDGGRTTEDRAQAEEQAFVDYVLGRAAEMRAGEQNVTMGNNGAIVPATIANRIIKAVKDRCPILERATIYNVKGTLKVPVWGDASGYGVQIGNSITIFIPVLQI